MEMFNALPTRNEDAIGVLSSMLETATFLRNSNFDSISSELIDAAYEYINAIKKYSHTPTPFPSATHHLDAQAVALDVPSIGTRIRQLRKDRMLTQAELAAAINVTTQAVSLWENDSSVMGVDKLLPLANALKCDLMWLLTGNATHQDLPDTDNGEHLYRHASQQAGDVSHEAPQR
ncbi:helix-turn-helix transcriptional regulator [Salmonella enterica subsp. enterica]|nr:helix-turn-helix transcriptional regulator [Salmonella enterica subsp. enterica]